MKSPSRLIFALPALLLAACSPEPAADPEADRIGRDNETPARGAPGSPIQGGPGVVPANPPVLGRDVVEPNDNPADSADKLADAEEQVNEAVSVVAEMKSDPEVAALLAEARGIFIVPDYAQAGLVVGGQGGEGVALLRNEDPAGGEWSAPAFFNLSGVTAGAAGGVEAGSIALLLMTEEAAQPFRNDESNFSLVSSASLTIVDFSARAEGDAEEGDIIIWSDTEGAFAGATVGVRGINRDEDDIEAFYGQGANAREILSGNRDTELRAQPLRDALSG
jgi:lipid-binding SYLF domain-containing protein